MWWGEGEGQRGKGTQKTGREAQREERAEGTDRGHTGHTRDSSMPYCAAGVVYARV